MSMIFGDVSRTWMLQEIGIKGDRINGLQPYNISHIFVGETTPLIRSPLTLTNPSFQRVTLQRTPPG